MYPSSIYSGLAGVSRTRPGRPKYVLYRYVERWGDLKNALVGVSR